MASFCEHTDKNVPDCLMKACVTSGREMQGGGGAKSVKAKL